MSNLVFRDLNPTSYDEVYQFLLTHEYSWRDSDPEGFIAKTEEKRDKTTLFFMEKMQGPDTLFCGICGFDENKMVGSHFIEIQTIDYKKAAHIHGLWVDPQYRGMGIASKLKVEGEKWAISQQCEMMDANVRVSNNAMIELNKKLGYKIERYNFRKNLKS